MSSDKSNTTEGLEPAVAEIIPLKGIRKAIASFMVESHMVPKATSISEIDMTEAMKFYKTVIADLAKKEGVRITITHLLLKACAEALVQNPAVNSMLVKDENGAPKEVKIFADRNIGMIVSTNDNLNIIPVVRNVDKMSLVETARKANEIADMTRQGIFPRENFVGATFTLTNLGMFGVKGLGVPLMGLNQSAIIATGVIEDKPVVRDGQIVIRKMMYASMSYDHRHLTGPIAGAFRQTMADVLEDPHKYSTALGL